MSVKVHSWTVHSYSWTVSSAPVQYRLFLFGAFHSLGLSVALLPRGLVGWTIRITATYPGEEVCIFVSLWKWQVAESCLTFFAVKTDVTRHRCFGLVGPYQRCVDTVLPRPQWDSNEIREVE